MLAATDPAQPYGAAIAWPEHRGGNRPTRAAGAHVVLVDGECVAYVERGGRSLLTFAGDPDVDDPDAWVDALVEAHKEGRLGRLQIERIDDQPARTSPHADRDARRRLRRRLQGPHAAQVALRSAVQAPGGRAWDSSTR